MSLGAIDWGIKVFCKELIVFLGYRSPCLCWGSMYDVCYVCMFVVCASFSCPCTCLLICLCVYELVLLFAASPVSNLPKFSTLKHSIFVQNGPSPFSSHISFLKQGPTYRAIPEKHGLLRWASGKEPTCRCRRLKKCGFSPWVRKIPGGGHVKSLQYSYLENPMDRGAWRAMVHGVAKSQKWLKHLSTHRETQSVSVYVICITWVLKSCVYSCTGIILYHNYCWIFCEVKIKRIWM